MCTTPGCPGDPAWASPGHGHLPECPAPKPYDGPPIEFRETEPVSTVGPYLVLVLLFAAAADGATPEELQRLEEARRLLQTRTPIPEIAQAILDARGPAWAPPSHVIDQMASLVQKDTP